MRSLSMCTEQTLTVFSLLFLVFLSFTVILSSPDAEHSFQSSIRRRHFNGETPTDTTQSTVTSPNPSPSLSPSDLPSESAFAPLSISPTPSDSPSPLTSSPSASPSPSSPSPSPSPSSSFHSPISSTSSRKSSTSTRSSTSLSSSTSIQSTSTSTTSIRTAIVEPSQPPSNTLTEPSEPTSQAQTGTDETASTTPAASDTPEATSKGFWANRGAVAGTFTALALILLGIISAIIISVLKNRTTHASEEDFFDKYPTANQDAPVEPFSPGVSMSDLAAQVPMNAYPTNEVHYGNNEYQHDHFVVEYPPAAATDYTANSTQEFDNYDSYYDPTAGNRISPTYVHPYADPSNVGPTTGLAPPIAPHPHVTRDSGYQYSIDSFYGAASARYSLT